MIIKKLLLTSNGFKNAQIGKEFLVLVGKKPTDIKVLFIPTAAETEKEMSYVYASEKELIELEILKENIFWLDMKKNSEMGDIQNYDAIYVCGGNTFHLMNELKNTGFGKKIIQFVNSGKVYVGVSAGSVIAGIDISIASPFDPNNVGLQDMRGFGFIDKMVSPHYQRKERAIIDEIAAKTSHEVLLLSDGQALGVFNEVSKIIE